MKAHENGKRLKVRWSTAKWTPAIKLVVGALRKESGTVARQALSLEVPLQKRVVRRRKPVLWAQSRYNGLPGLNNSRTSWR